MERTGKTFIVELKTGASSRITYDFVAKSAPDGYTLAATDPGYSILPAVFKLTWDHANDLVPVTMYARTPHAVVAMPTSRFKTVADLVEYARANPGKVTFGHSGAGTTGFILMQQFMREAKVELTHVPYKSGADALQELMANTIDLMVTGAPTIIPFMSYVSLVKHLLEKPDVLADLGAKDRGIRDEAAVAEPPVQGPKEPAWYRLLGAVGLRRRSRSTLSVETSEITFRLTVEGEISAEIIAEMTSLASELGRMRGACSLRVRKIGKGSVVIEFDGTGEDLAALTRMLEAGTLASRIRRGVVALQQSKPTLPRTYPRSVSFTAGSTTVVCHLGSIVGFTKEHDRAIQLISRRSTTNLSECIVYLTHGRDQLIYAHSNFTKSGYGHPTKIATNETNDLLLLLFNLVSTGDSTPFESERIRRAHESEVLYLIDSSLFDPANMPLVSINGASRVIRMDMETPQSGSASERASS